MKMRSKQLMVFLLFPNIIRNTWEELWNLLHFISCSVCVYTPTTQSDSRNSLPHCAHTKQLVLCVRNFLGILKRSSCL